MVNLVTGASGILGSYVVAELVKQGEKVVACRQAKSSLLPIQKVFALRFEDWEEQFKKLAGLETGQDHQPDHSAELATGEAWEW